MKMATKTTNYGLEKPDGTDFYDVDVQNSNMDIIDKQMKANANAITQLNPDRYFKRIFSGKIGEEFIIPNDYKEIIIQITIAFTDATDITLPEIYINDLETWWNKITSYWYNNSYNACILLNYNNGNRKIKMNPTWYICNPNSNNIGMVIYGR